MKKILLLFCLSALCFRATGQQLNLGIVLGPNVSSYVPPASQEPEGTKYSALFDFHAGLIGQLAIGSIYIQPGVIYESIGGKVTGYDDDLGGGAFSDNNSLRYLQVPLNVLYHTKSNKFFFGGGPYVAFALSGTVTQTNVGSTDDYESNGITTTSNNSYKFTFGGSNNPEFGLNLVGGVRVPGNFIFTAGASLAAQNKVYNLSIGRMFW